MPDLEIDMHSNPFGDQNDPDRNFDQISVGTLEISMNIYSLIAVKCLHVVNIRRSITIDIAKC
jgi:hypothetical protein